MDKKGRIEEAMDKYIKENITFGKDSDLKTGCSNKELPPENGNEIDYENDILITCQFMNLRGLQLIISIPFYIYIYIYNPKISLIKITRYTS